MQMSNKINKNEYIRGTVVDNKMIEVVEKNIVNDILHFSVRFLLLKIEDKTNISEANISRAKA